MTFEHLKYVMFKVIKLLHVKRGIDTMLLLRRLNKRFFKRVKLMRLLRTSTLFFILYPIWQYIKLAKHKSEWRKKNYHNFTCAKNLFPIDKVTVGKQTYGDIEFCYYGGKYEELRIGNYCSIACNVKFLGGGEHPVNHLSTYPFLRHVFKMPEGESIMKGIIIYDDVWIGDGVTVLSGVTINQGAIIGAKSIVTKDVPPYAIWIGNNVLKYRFDKKVCEKLSKLDLDTINLNAFKLFCDMEITEYNVDYIISKISR